MRTRGRLKSACIFALVALTPSPAFAAHVVESTEGPGEQSAQDKAQLEVQASLSKLNDIIQALSPNIGSARHLSEGDTLVEYVCSGAEDLFQIRRGLSPPHQNGELILSVVTSIPSLGGGSFNPIGNKGGSLGGSGLGSVLFGGSGLGSNLFGGSNFGSSLLRGSSLGGNLLGVGGFASNLFGGSSSGDGNGMTEIIDVLGSDIPFSTGSFLLDTKGATVPAKLDNMLKTTGLSPEESSMLDITAHSIGLAAGISIALAAGLLTVFYSGWLLEESLRLITGPYNWGLTVRQTWNNALNSRNSAGKNADIWTDALTKTAERISSFKTGALKQELASLRGQLGNLLKQISAAQSRFS